MSDNEPVLGTGDLPAFSRKPLGQGDPVSGIGLGCIGGKASGLVGGMRVLEAGFPSGEFEGIEVAIPSLAVLGTDLFETFLLRNDLAAFTDGQESDERIAHAFQRASFPTEFVGDLRALAAGARTPLAVRSSSLLEDATGEPFAGIYGTKMIPNNEPSPDARFKRLVQALKFVYASTFFRDARGYRRRTGRESTEEKMAVIVQQVVGLPHQNRFYPTVAGVARSWNYYPMGPASAEEGVVDLALGLGKTIVDGEGGWSFSPAHPKAPPPLTTSDLLKQTQRRFWAVNMGKPPAFDPTAESEFLVQGDLSDAELDGSLTFVASTYDPQNDRVTPGIGRPGPRIVDFSPILKATGIALNELVSALLRHCEEVLGCPVEIEFALSIDPLRRAPPRFGFLQVRPIVVAKEGPSLEIADLSGESVLAASERVLGHGTIDTLTDVVYIRPEAFSSDKTRHVAFDFDRINNALREEGRHCLLMTFGRLGSSDPWLGVPVDWGQVSQARAVVEATTPDMDVDLSQGSHFFHNVTSLKICYFTVHHAGAYRIAWDLLDRLPAESETAHVRHVRLPEPLKVRVDGRHGRGVITL